MLANPNRLLSKEMVKKTVGSRKDPVNSFKKGDFLSKRSLASKFKESADLIDKTLKHMYSHKVSFSVNGRRSLIVTKDVSGQILHLHPLAMDIFKEYIEKQKAKL